MAFDALIAGLIAGFALGLFTGAVLFSRRRTAAPDKQEKP